MKLIIFGESHVQSIKSALKQCHHESNGQIDVRVFKYLKTRNGRTGGDLSHSQLLDFAAELQINDVLVFSIGGNQNHLLALVQHPIPFDVFTTDMIGPEANRHYIPYYQIYDVYLHFLTTDVSRMTELKQAANCSVFMALPPPPKENNIFLLEHAGDTFIRFGVRDLGVSEPALRLKMYKIQCDIISRISSDSSISVIPPPAECVTASGYLKPEYYAKDATHANTDYGHAMLKHLIDFTKHIVQ
jgi:hypothetical protein